MDSELRSDPAKMDLFTPKANANLPCHMGTEFETVQGYAGMHVKDLQCMAQPKTRVLESKSLYKIHQESLTAFRVQQNLLDYLVWCF